MRLSSERAAALLAMRPELIGACMGVLWYEHPERGDSVGLLAYYQGILYTTDHYSVPCEDELSPADLIEIYSN